MNTTRIIELKKTEIDRYQKHLEIASRLQDNRSKGDVLGNLGLAYHELGEYQKARDCFQQQLEISREINDPYSQGNALGNLGLVFQVLGEYETAIRYLEKQLEI